MIRNVWVWVLAMILIGCAVKVVSDPAKRAGEIGTSIERNAKGIKQDVVEGKKVAPKANDVFVRIDSKADNILTETPKLADLQTQIASEKSAHEKQLADLNKKLDRANSLYQRIAVWAIVATGILVALGVWLHDFTIGIAAVAGCGAIMAGSLLMTAMTTLLIPVTLGLIAVCVGWVGFDWYKRGSLWDALKTGPSDDLKEWGMK